MKAMMIVAAMAAAAIAGDALLAQATLPIPYGGGGSGPVSQTLALDPRDTPEEIAKDSARDLNEFHIYNKPGATRAQYDADWQLCRLIARGSRTPAGTIYYNYNPALVSSMAAGMGGALGGLSAGAIIEGQQRPANREACMLIKGWRAIDLAREETARIVALPAAARDAYLNTALGSASPNGKLTEQTSFALESDPALHLDAPIGGAASVFVGRKVDPAVPVVAASGEALLVIGFRRPDAATAGRSAMVQLSRYDRTTNDLVYQPRDWKKQGDRTSYVVSISSGDRKAPYEVEIIRVTAGDYVISSTSVAGFVPTSVNCFGAPVFHVGPGDTAYLGDFLPYFNATLSSGKRITTLAYATHVDDARSALATRQPALAAAMRPADYRNHATFGCAGVMMDRWDLPGVEPIAPPPSAAAPATPPAAG